MRTKFGLIGWLLVWVTVFVTAFVVLIDVVILVDPPPPQGPRGALSNRLFLAGGYTFGLIVWYWLVWWLLPPHRQFDPAWRGVVQTTPTGTRVHLYPMARMAGAWGILLYTFIISALVYGFSPGEEPYPTAQAGELFPNRQWFAAVCGLVGVTYAVGAWRSWWLTGYLHDDEKAGTLSLRKPLLTIHGRAISRSAITVVSVQVSAALPTGLSRHRVVVHWVPPGRRPDWEVVADYFDPASASALARWIRERLGLGDGPHSPAPSP